MEVYLLVVILFWQDIYISLSQRNYDAVEKLNCIINHACLSQHSSTIDNQSKFPQKTIKMVL